MLEKFEGATPPEKMAPGNAENSPDPKKIELLDKDALTEDEERELEEILKLESEENE